MIVEIHPPDVRLRSDDGEHRLDHRGGDRRIATTENEVVRSESDHPAVGLSPGRSDLSRGDDAAVRGTDRFRNSTTGLRVDDVREARLLQCTLEVPTGVVHERVPDHRHAATHGSARQWPDADLLAAYRRRRCSRQPREFECRCGWRAPSRSLEQEHRAPRARAWIRPTSAASPYGAIVAARRRPYSVGISTQTDRRFDR